MDHQEEYARDLEARFRSYWEKVKNTIGLNDDVLDKDHGGGRLPVFKKNDATLNIIQKQGATAEELERLLNIIPERKRHRWYRSMSSSQALALSVFGNIIIHGEIKWLADLKDASGSLFFGNADLSSYNVSMEHEIAILNEPRPTSLDLLISGRYRVAIECKLSETEFGTCSRTRLPNTSSEFCSGQYQSRLGQQERCSLTKLGIRYWNYVPAIFKWKSSLDQPCPIKDTYQLVRNVLAACVRDDGIVSPDIGHAVLIYDDRNPAFIDGGKGDTAFQATQSALKNQKNLNRISWQQIVGYMKERKYMSWLTQELYEKYGIA